MGGVTPEAIWQALEEVKDPEIPVVSLVEMGIVRQVAVEDDRVVVTITPTFSGCPALHVMKEDIKTRLARMGVDRIEVRILLSPPWTTDWIDDEARRKLKAFGLAPPPVHGGEAERMLLLPVACPYCDSEDTVLKNSFGPTLCREIHYCTACQQPFERFKLL